MWMLRLASFDTFKKELVFDLGSRWAREFKNSIIKFSTVNNENGWSYK